MYMFWDIVKEFSFFLELTYKTNLVTIGFGHVYLEDFYKDK